MYRIYILHVILLKTALVIASSKTASKISPVGSFDTSWAASCTQGATLAIAYPRGDGDRGYILVSPRARILQGQEEDKEEDFIKTNGVHCVDGLLVQTFRDTRDKIRGIEGSVPKHWFLENCVVSFTGLISDVNHVATTLQQQLDNHRIVYEDSALCSAFKVTDTVSSILMEAEGRLFGVQVLVLGMSARKQLLQLYSLDPSGGYRHWGMATAIGKAAAEHRANIYKQLSEKRLQDAKEALVVALESLKGGQSSGKKQSNLDMYDAWMCWVEDGRLRVGKVWNGHVKECIALNEKAARV